MAPESVVLIAWLLWLASWWAAAAAWSDRAVKRPGVRREIVYRLMFTAGAMLLFASYPRRSTDWLLWNLGPGTAWGMVLFAVIGLSFTWWARIYLGRLWSSGVTRKAHHRIVDRGPYGVVRHPIYAGITLAALATAILRGTVVGVMGAALMILGCYIKARLEEHFLREQLGAEAYDAYARRVPMLVPFTR
jgi:protein-S-isoprenylcysteine O-methyltransferase Ste14